ncbi:MAG: lipoate--protein ligase family protein [Pirellulales bacterium]
MHRLMLTLDTPAENLALDEALLDEAEAAGPASEVLRLWESPEPLVVLGRSSRVDVEVDAAACAARGIPILRRSSGGAAIVAGPGCLMYAVVLSYARRPEAHGIHQSHGFVLDRLVDALRPHVKTVARAGTSDLVLGDEDDKNIARKISGNSLRVKRTHFLYHGTLLYDFDLPLIAACLQTPPRQPEYRHARGHGDFVANLPLGRETLEAAVAAAWPTVGELTDWPRERVAELVRERYRRDDWNLGYGLGAR